MKLLLAATSFGTSDVWSWISFSQGVREFGLLHMYGQDYYFSTYNHPPFSGVLLLAMNWVVDAGWSDIPFLIRSLSSLADVVTAVLVFELVRLHRSVGKAMASGVLISLSPALILISGFHGNTDPVLVMFTLLAAYLVAKDRSFPAGVAIGLAISVKLVPIVAVPVLGVQLLRSGWRSLRSFVGGGLVVFAVLWVPVLIASGPAFRRDVLGYAGLRRDWGLPQFIEWAGMPEAWTSALSGPGRFLLLLVSGLLPAALVWRRPRSFVPAVGLSLVLFLLLCTTFGTQYLSWALAAAYSDRVSPGNGLQPGRECLCFRDLSRVERRRTALGLGHGPGAHLRSVRVATTGALLGSAGVGRGRCHLDGGSRRPGADHRAPRPVVSCSNAVQRPQQQALWRTDRTLAGPGERDGGTLRCAPSPASGAAGPRPSGVESAEGDRRRQPTEPLPVAPPTAPLNPLRPF